jgi:DNA-binding NarL/FixJ family response regulator
MTLQALLVSTDNAAADALGRVLPTFGMAMDRSSDPETTVTRIQQQKFDMLIVDFDDAKLAEAVLQRAQQINPGSLSVALVKDPAEVRQILSGGAHFVLYKPVSEEAAKAGLRAAAAMLSRERRRSFRVPVQAPVEITLPDQRKADGILLDLSETGMDVLTPEAQTPETLLGFRFELPDGALQIEGQGKVAWANSNGQTGVRITHLPEAVATGLKGWLKTVATSMGAETDEIVPHCKLTDLSLGGCYVETDAPFPERSLVDLCLKTDELEVHTEGMVRVNHPGHGMGVEFPSRTAEQRAQVGNLISVLRSSPEKAPELTISPRALIADLTQFEPAKPLAEGSAAEADELEDPLLELLRRGASLRQDDFLAELHHQRSPQDVASA